MSIPTKRDLGITPGECEAARGMCGKETTEWFIVMDGDDVSVAANIVDPSTGKPSEANALVLADAMNTANKTGLLPSELLAQRDALVEAMVEFCAMTADNDDSYLSNSPGVGMEIIGLTARQLLASLGVDKQWQDLYGMYPESAIRGEVQP